MEGNRIFLSLVELNSANQIQNPVKEVVGLLEEGV